MSSTLSPWGFTQPEDRCGDVLGPVGVHRYQTLLDLLCPAAREAPVFPFDATTLTVQGTAPRLMSKSLIDCSTSQIRTAWIPGWEWAAMPWA